VYSLGIILYYLCFGSTFFEDNEDIEKTKYEYIYIYFNNIFINNNHIIRLIYIFTIFFNFFIFFIFFNFFFFLIRNEDFYLKRRDSDYVNDDMWDIVSMINKIIHYFFISLFYYIFYFFILFYYIFYFI
jgi:hypothetical protein